MLAAAAAAEDLPVARILVSNCVVEQSANSLYLPEAAVPHPVVGVEEVDAMEQLQEQRREHLERLELAAAVAFRGMHRNHSQAAHLAGEVEEVVDAKVQLQEQCPEEHRERRSHRRDHSHSCPGFAATVE